MEMSTIIKRVKELGPTALIGKESFRNFVEKFESEINRGISTLCILSIINRAGNEGIYGYKILKELEGQTRDMLVVEEGTLYPLLKKLERDKIIASESKESGGRRRKYYFLTQDGFKIFNHLTGFYSKLSEAISPLLDIYVDLSEKYIYCPNCANKIDIEDQDYKFCEICGLNIQELKEKRLEK
jgi:PadR family transcriptional regulator PadR